MNRYLSSFAFALSLGAAACSSDKTPASPGSAKDGGADSGKAPSTFKLHWALQDINGIPTNDGGTDAGADAGAPTAPPVEGVKVCVNGHAEIPCVTSAADGTFDLLGLPPRTNLVLTLDKIGYVKESKTIQTASTDMDVTTGNIFMVETAKNVLPSGVTQDPAMGAVDFFAIGPIAGNSDPNAFQTEPGVSVSLSPAQAAASGPYFSDRNGKFDPTTKTTLNGFGFYYNLAPGEYTITYTDSQYDCAPITLGLSGWGIPDPPTSVKFTVLPGYLTDEVGTFCTVKSVIVNTGDGG